MPWPQRLPTVADSHIDEIRTRSNGSAAKMLITKVWKTFENPASRRLLTTGYLLSVLLLPLLRLTWKDRSCANINNTSGTKGEGCALTVNCKRFSVSNGGAMDLITFHHTQSKNEKSNQIESVKILQKFRVTYFRCMHTILHHLRQVDINQSSFSPRSLSVKH